MEPNTATWIKPEDQLPENGSLVAVIYETDYSQHPYTDVHEVLLFWDLRDGTFRHLGGRVLYWYPLPNAPEGVL